MVMLTFMYKILYVVIPPKRANSMAEYVKRSVSSISHLCAQKSKSVNEAAMLVPFYRYSWMQNEGVLTIDGILMQIEEVNVVMVLMQSRSYLGGSTSICDIAVYPCL